MTHSHPVFLSLGSNLGARLANLRRAVSACWRRRCRSPAFPPVYETEPWGYLDQPRFLNMALAAETDLDPGELLAHIKGIELQMGRHSTFQYGPRIIDLDILFYGGALVDQPGLQIPHPHLAERPFVLVPLCDLDPDLVHPALGKSVSQLLEERGSRRSASLQTPQVWPAHLRDGHSQRHPGQLFGRRADAARRTRSKLPWPRRAASSRPAPHILDIGGESTRPGSQPVGAEEELARVLPVVQRPGRGPAQ